jgi:predicted amidophosphoribosyltransferase
MQAAGGVRSVKGLKRPPLKPFYRGWGYCSSCGLWLPLSAAVRDAAGWPRCPRCGRPLRVKPRNRLCRRAWRRWEP